MQSVYLNEKTEFGSLNTWEMKNQNRYGSMYGISPKLDLITTDYVGEYYVFRSSHTNKLFLVVDNDKQLGNALIKIQVSLNKDKGFYFKKSKNIYILKLAISRLQTYQNIITC